MSNEQNTQKSALQIFVEDPSTHYALERRLAYLLGDRGWFSSAYTDEGDYGHLTLTEFQDYFDWDKKYSVETSWSVSVCNPVEESYECSSMEEALAYKNGEKDFDEPDLCSFYPEVELDTYAPYETLISVEIDNLRLKPQQPKTQYELTFIVEPRSAEVREIQEWIEQVRGRTANGGTIKIVDSTLKPVEQSTTWSEVVGQK